MSFISISWSCVDRLTVALSAVMDSTAPLSNDDLQYLPPLPETPRFERRMDSASGSSVRQSTSRIFQPTKIVSSHSRTPSQTKLNDHDSVLGLDDVWGGPSLSPRKRAMPKSSSKNDLFRTPGRTELPRSSSRDLASPPKYPVMSTRQSSINIPRSASSSRIITVELRLTRNLPVKSPPADIPPLSAAADQLTPPHPKLTIPTAEPSQLELPSAAPDLAFSSMTNRQASTSPVASLSASMLLPKIQGNLDISLINDESFLGGSTDDSFDWAIEDLRPKSVKPNPLPEPSELGYQKARGKTEDVSITPTRIIKQSKTPTRDALLKAADTARLAPSTSKLDESTLFPVTPAKSAHLLTSAYQIKNTEPLWTGDESITAFDLPPVTRQTPFKANTSREEKGHSRSSSLDRKSPALSSSKSKRAFPASSSGSTLASVLEGSEAGLQDVSALFPVTPSRYRHLMTDQSMIMDTKLDEGPSIRATLPRGPDSSAKSSVNAYPSKSTNRSTPSSSSTVKRAGGDAGDVTLDVHQ